MPVFRILLLCVILDTASLSPALAQDLNLTETIISVAEQLAQDEEDQEAAVTYTEKLYELADDPVRINSADQNEIARLFFLSDFQIKSLAEYSHSTGKIFSVYEIANIPGFDREITEMMIPFINLESKPEIRTDSLRFNNTLITNFSLKPGLEDSLSSGSLWKILTKYKLSSGPVSCGFTAEKDAGERMLSKGMPDFFSSYLAFKGKGFVKRFVIGDYSARFGQGLNVNTGLRTGISLTAPGYMSAANELRQYTSTDENRFFRGMAAGFSTGKIDLDLFYSYNDIDASSSLTDGYTPDHIESLYTAGLHNTDQLMNKKDILSIQTYGANLTFDLGNIRLGAVWTLDKLSLPLINDDPQLRNIFDFTGNRNQLYSVYYSSIIKRMLFYGEFSLNDSLQHAFIQGASLKMSDRLTVNLFLRNYEAGYYSFHGKGPGSSITWNETSLTGNFSFEAARNLFVGAGAEFRQFPWLRYRCSAPSYSSRNEVRIRYNPADNLKFEALYNYGLAFTDDTQSEKKSIQKENKTRSLRVSARYSPYENFTLGTRIDYKTYNQGESEGFLMFQDAGYTFKKAPLSIWFRYCLFRTDSWDSRLYAYENDILNSFSIPVLSGEGSRSYMMIRWKIFRMGELRIRYGFTSVKDKNAEDLKLQFKLNF
jgi:hypothetical protein